MRLSSLLAYHHQIIIIKQYSLYAICRRMKSNVIYFLKVFCFSFLFGSRVSLASFSTPNSETVKRYLNKNHPQPTSPQLSTFALTLPDLSRLSKQKDGGLEPIFLVKVFLSLDFWIAYYKSATSRLVLFLSFFLLVCNTSFTLWFYELI